RSPARLATWCAPRSSVAAGKRFRTVRRASAPASKAIGRQSTYRYTHDRDRRARGRRRARASPRPRQPKPSRTLIRLQSDSNHLLVVFGFGRHGDFLASGGVNAAAAATAGVALILAWSHLRVRAAEGGDLGRKLDDGLL